MLEQERSYRPYSLL